MCGSTIDIQPLWHWALVTVIVALFVAFGMAIDYLRCRKILRRNMRTSCVRVRNEKLTEHRLSNK